MMSCFAFAPESTSDIAAIVSAETISGEPSFIDKLVIPEYISPVFATISARQASGSSA